MAREPDQSILVVRARRRLRQIRWPTLALFWFMAIGIGVNTGVFSVGALLFPPLPYPHPEQLVVLQGKTHHGDSGIQTEDFRRIEGQTRLFQDLGASSSRTFRLNTPAGSKRISASLVTPGFFDMMGDHFDLGHDFDPTIENDKFAILSHAMWEQLGRSNVAVGSAITLDESPYTVVGVLAGGLRDRGAPVSIPLLPSIQQDLQRVNVTGRLRSGISVARAQSDLEMYLAHIARGHLGITVVPINSAAFQSDWRFATWLALGLVSYLFLVECVSVVSMFRLRTEATLKRDLKLFGEY
jgi:putative ABC transport system permease protein